MAARATELGVYFSRRGSIVSLIDIVWMALGASAVVTMVFKMSTGHRAPFAYFCDQVLKSFLYGKYICKSLQEFIRGVVERVVWMF